MLVKKIVDTIFNKMYDNPDVIMLAIAEEVLSPIFGEESSEDIEDALNEYSIAIKVCDAINNHLIANLMVNKAINIPGEARAYIEDTVWDSSRDTDLTACTFSSLEYNFAEVLKDAYEIHLEDMFGGFISHNKCRDMAREFVSNLHLQ